MAYNADLQEVALHGLSLGDFQMKELPDLTERKSQPAEQFRQPRYLFWRQNLKVALLSVDTILGCETDHLFIGTVVFKVFRDVMLASGIGAYCQNSVLHAAVVKPGYLIVVQAIVHGDNPVCQLRGLFRI